MINHGLARTAIALTSVLSSLTACIAQGTWTQMTSPDLSWINSLVFLNADTGYAAGFRNSALNSPWNPNNDPHGVLYRTIDGANSWQLLLEDSSSSESYIKDISFVDVQHGYCLTNGITVHRTSDGGLSWASDSVGAECTLASDICFPQVNYGFVKAYFSACGARRTFDGGANWEPVPLFPDYYDMDFVSPSIGYAAVPGTGLMKTNSGGFTWLPDDNTDAVSGLIKCLDFCDATHGCASTLHGDVYYHTLLLGIPFWLGASAPTTGDETISDITSSISGYAMIVGFIGGVAGDARVFISSDFGESWTEQNLGLPAMSECSMLPSGVGYMSGFDQVWKFEPDGSVAVTDVTQPSSDLCRAVVSADAVHILSDQLENGIVQLFDARGALVATTTLTGRDTRIDRSALSPGFYVGMIRPEQGMAQRTVFVLP